MQEPFGLEVWTVHRLNYHVLEVYLLLKNGCKRIELQWSIEALISCHNPTIPKAQAVKQKHMDYLILYISDTRYNFSSLCQLWVELRHSPLIILKWYQSLFSQVILLDPCRLYSLNKKSNFSTMLVGICTVHTSSRRECCTRRGVRYKTIHLLSPNNLSFWDNWFMMTRSSKLRSFLRSERGLKDANHII